jgi:hypothetical protein
MNKVMASPEGDAHHFFVCFMESDSRGRTVLIERLTSKRPISYMLQSDIKAFPFLFNVENIQLVRPQSVLTRFNLLHNFMKDKQIFLSFFGITNASSISSKSRHWTTDYRAAQIEDRMFSLMMKNGDVDNTTIFSTAHHKLSCISSREISYSCSRALAIN